MIAAFVLGAVFSLKMMATGLVYVAIFLAFWLPYSLVVIIRNQEKRKVQAFKIGIWFLMIVTVLAVHLVRKAYVRGYADSVVLKIEQFQRQQGRYPDNLDEIGVSREEFKNRLGMSQYTNRPLLYYADTMMIFHSWSYDFGVREWINEGD